ncbi:hypothetical protein DFQ27_001816, partial [Actinomortierella ambigua]
MASDMEVDSEDAKVLADRQRIVDSLREQVDRLESLVEAITKDQATRLPVITAYKHRTLDEKQTKALEALMKERAADEAKLVDIEADLSACRKALSSAEAKLPASPEEDVLNSLCHSLGYKKQLLPLIPNTRRPRIDVLQAKLPTGLSQFPYLEMVSRGESANALVFSFLRDFENRLQAGVSKEVFGLLSYPFMRTAIRDHDVLTNFERLMIPVNESHSWSWDATKKAFMQAVDQESAIGDAVARLYSIEPLEKEDYKGFVSRIRELLKQVADADNHVNLMYRITMCISSDGRAKVLEHFEDMKKIPSLEHLLDFLQKQ